MAKFLSSTQIVNAIEAWGADRPILIQGENGIGKTAIFHQLKRRPAFADHIAVDPIDATQLSDGSVWMPDIDREQGVSRELPNDRFGVSRTNQRGINGAKPVIAFVDELAKCSQFIKNMLAPVFYERRVGQYHMVEGSVVFGATNLSVEGLGDNIQAHLRNRLIVLNMRKPTAEEWIRDFAIPAGLHPTVIAFVHNYPNVMDSFLDYEPGGKYEGKTLAKENGMIFNPKAVQSAYATPRSLHTASDEVMRAEQFGLDDETLEAGLEGSVGVVTAQTMASFIRFGRDLVAYERVIRDPETAPLSDNPTAQLVQVMQFVTRVKDRAEAEAIVKYVTRMRAEIQSVFASTVAQSTKLSTFVTLQVFANMLAEHRIFFTGTK